MISKAEIKELARLHQKKFRDQENKILVEGEKMIAEALSSGWECELILHSNDFSFSGNYGDIYQPVQSLINTVPVKELERLSDTVTPQHIIAVFRVPPVKKTREEGRVALLLDSVSDPGNFGTIIRTADWFGVHNIYTTGNCADYLNPKVVRASMGSMFRTAIIRLETGDDIRSYLRSSGRKMICADMHGTPLNRLHPESEKLILLLGNEANGPSDEVKSLAHQTAVIPGYGKAESLNVASAAAVFLYALTNCEL